MQYIFQEIINLKESRIKTGAQLAFEYPCLLGGQTFDNQTGFGSEFYGNELISEGTLYGETTDFIIIGVIVGYLFN